MEIALQSRWLGASFQVRRWGWMACTGLLLCLLGVLGWIWWIPAMKDDLAQQQLQLERIGTQERAHAAEAPADASASTGQDAVTAFNAVLGDAHYVEQQVKTLFSIARGVGVRLDKAQYKSASDKNSNLQTYQIVLPVTGSYAAIRTFCAEVLLAIPFASLDEMSFRRETVSEQSIEAKLRFTLYLAAP